MKACKKRMVVLGGGFGGAALRLQKLLGAKLSKREVEITLVSRDNFFLELLRIFPVSGWQDTKNRPGQGPSLRSPCALASTVPRSRQGDKKG